MTDGSCWSELTGGVAVIEALVLALPGRGSVDVVTGSAEEVSTSEVVSAEATAVSTAEVWTSLLLPLKVVSVVRRGGRLTELPTVSPGRV